MATLQKKYPFILMIAAILITLQACSEDNGSQHRPPGNDDVSDINDSDDKEPGTSQPECKKSVCLDDKTLNECVDGKYKEVKCSGNQICKDDACKEDDPAEQPEIPEKPEETPCTQSVCDEDGHTLHECIAGTVITADCSLLNMTCENGECVDLPCEDGTVICDGEILKTCVDHKLHKQNCAASNQFCNLELKSCDIIECEENYQPHCADVKTLVSCQTHKIIEEECPENHICSKDECIPDPCASCTPSQLCINETCLDSYDGSLLGIPCKCESDDCNIPISSTDVKSMLKKAILLVAAKYLNKLGPDDNVLIPDYFSPSNRGCEALEAVVPEGMSVGCFRDSQIYVPPIYEELIAVDAPALIKTFDITLTPKMLNLIDKAAEFASSPIQIPAPNGYCMTAAIELDADINQSPFNMAIEEGALSKDSPIVSKLNTGEPDIVEANSNGSDDYCPDGGTLFIYDIDKTLPKIGDLHTKADVCLRACTENTDCPDSSACINIPTELSLSNPDVPRKQACFYQETADLVKGMMQEVIELMN